jgi:hypothetical protein
MTQPAGGEQSHDAGSALPFEPIEARLERYGPFPATRRRMVLFSSGSDWEDHGPAMAPGSDTHFAQAFCTGAALRTGIRYLAHAPFATDVAGECARLFNPIWVPEGEHFGLTADYCAGALDAVRPRPEGVLIHVPWHGQHVMGRKIEEFAARLGVRKARLIPDIVVEAAFSLTEQDYRDSPLAELAREGVETKAFQHCGFFDYSVAEALGHLDRGRLAQLRAELEVDAERTLRKHPGVHDLAGYVRYGGRPFDGLREALGVGPEGPFPAVEARWQNSCPVVGRAIVERTIAIAVQHVLDFEAELFEEGGGGEDGPAFRNSTGT